MGCRKLDISDYYRLTPTTASELGSISDSPGMQKTAYSRFKPVVSVSISNYRYYSPELGRWLSRDPIKEDGGINLYVMVENNSINLTDYLGKGLWSTLWKLLKLKKCVQDAKDKYDALISTCTCPPLDQKGVEKCMKDAWNVFIADWASCGVDGVVGGLQEMLPEGASQISDLVNQILGLMPNPFMPDPVTPEIPPIDDSPTLDEIQNTVPPYYEVPPTEPPVFNNNSSDEEIQPQPPVFIIDSTSDQESLPAPPVFYYVPPGS